MNMDLGVQVVYADPGLPGYHPVNHMARLAAELLEGQLIVLEPRSLTKLEKLEFLLPRRRSGLPCLLICSSPADLSSILLIEKWRKRYGRMVAWVFDSFWPNLIPRFATLSGAFDQVFVTELDDIDTWRKRLAVPVEWLPWGSDVLRLGSANPCRRLDLLRIGRQPREWDDDDSTSTVCESRGLSFEGRPPTFVDATQSERSLMAIESTTKYILAFSNRFGSDINTHPRREYITGRWTDALAAGAIVAGVPPHSQSVQSLLWEEALLDLGTANRAKGVDVIARAVSEWSPERARLNYVRALERLDWRWRFKRLAAALDVRARHLENELENLSIQLQDATRGDKTLSAKNAPRALEYV
jgi:hypothetical protein